MSAKATAAEKAKRRETNSMYMKIAGFGVLFSIGSIASSYNRYKAAIIGDYTDGSTESFGTLFSIPFIAILENMIIGSGKQFLSAGQKLRERFGCGKETNKEKYQAPTVM